MKRFAELVVILIVVLFFAAFVSVVQEAYTTYHQRFSHDH